MTTKKYPSVNSFFILTLLVAFMFHGCHKKDSDLLKKKTYAAVLTELMVIEKLGTDKVHKTVLVQAVLDSFNITSEQFKATTEHYKEQPDFWLKMYKLTEKKVTEKEKLLQTKQPKKK